MTDTVRLPRITRDSAPALDACETTVDLFTDAVSGAASPEYCIRELRREYARCRRYGHPLAVIACDIDRLALINEGFGRPAGDAALRALANRATRVVRSSDWIGRKVDDEFVIVLPETTLEGAAVVADRVRHAMAGQPVSLGKISFTVTLSVGYSALETTTDLARFGAEELLETAERQLVQSARHGRNRATGTRVERSLHPSPRRSQTSGRLTEVTAPTHLSLAEDHLPTPARPVRANR